MSADVLKNEAVLKDTKLLTYLSNSDLLNCRLVCSTWLTPSTEILTRRQNCRLTFRHFGESDHRGEYYKYENYQKYFQPCAEYSLENLTTCLQNSRHFPCTNFCFYDGALNGKDVQGFLDFFGSQIKCLSFDLKAILDILDEHGEVKCQFKLRSVLEKVPNVESLAIWNYQGTPLPPPLLPLHFDQALYLGAEYSKKFLFNKIVYMDILRELLNSATHLKSFPLSLYLFRDKEVIDLFLKFGKLKIVEKLNIGTFDTRNYFDDNYFEKLKGVELHFKKIDISMHSHLNEWGVREARDENGGIISKILRNSSNYCQQIKLYNFPRYIDSFSWPVMKKVKSVSFYLGSARDEESTKPESEDSRGFNWSEIFPALETVQLESSGSYYKDNNWENNFLNVRNTAHTVKTLRIGSMVAMNCLEKWLTSFSTIFPNVENIELSVGNFPNVSAALFKFKKLRKMKLTLFMYNTFPLNKLAAIDASFTGLPKDLCKTLATSTDILNVQECRSEPSILDLRELQKLELTFAGCVVPSVRVMSMYAFKLMPQLRVKICYCGV